LHLIQLSLRGLCCGYGGDQVRSGGRRAGESATAGLSADTDLSGCGVIDTAMAIRAKPMGNAILPAHPAAGMMRRKIGWARDLGRGSEGCSGASPCHSHKPDSLLSVLIKTAFAEPISAHRPLRLTKYNGETRKSEAWSSVFGLFRYPQPWSCKGALHGTIILRQQAFQVTGTLRTAQNLPFPASFDVYFHPPKSLRMRLCLRLLPLWHVHHVV
jgi:hypothetical protein